MEDNCGVQGATAVPTHGSEKDRRYEVADATERNWIRLNTDPAGRLTARANKRKSEKRIIPKEYLRDPQNMAFLQQILGLLDVMQADVFSAIYTLGIVLLEKHGILEKRNVTSVLSAYPNGKVLEELRTANVPEDEFDFLGLVYQCLLPEGEKNIKGSYYTPQKIVRNMTKNFAFSHGETFLDPCCGSGAFLLAVDAADPNQLFGIDNDDVAVLIAKINLLIKYKDIDFDPQVYCLNFLDDSLLEQCQMIDRHFDYIATNPPWGAMNNSHSSFSPVSKDSFGIFFLKSFGLLKKGGTIRFLFPEAICNVKAHREIRRFLIDTAGLVGITAYDDAFSGVTTKCVDIECGGRAKKGSFLVCSGGVCRTVKIENICETENLVFNLLSGDDMRIIQSVREYGRYTLENSTWALGIVTGNNKEKLSLTCQDGMEHIYTGKEICPYTLLPAKYYIRYDRESLQQAAREEIYRAPEKLVYRFISSKLVFAYDNSASLFLNSANILIPNIPNMSIKTVMAFLNSTLFRFVYKKMFGEVKILKENLMKLPFPAITEEENAHISSLVDDILAGDNTKESEINDCVFSLHHLNNNEIQYIRDTMNETV